LCNNGTAAVVVVNDGDDDSNDLPNNGNAPSLSAVLQSGRSRLSFPICPIFFPSLQNNRPQPYPAHLFLFSILQVKRLRLLLIM